MLLLSLVVSEGVNQFAQVAQRGLMYVKSLGPQVQSLLKLEVKGTQ